MTDFGAPEYRRGNANGAYMSLQEVCDAQDDEIERLKDEVVELREWKNLAVDLADVLPRMVVGWEERLGVDLAQHPDVQRVMARYRALMGR